MLERVSEHMCMFWNRFRVGPFTYTFQHIAPHLSTPILPFSAPNIFQVWGNGKIQIGSLSSDLAVRLK